jgi:uncharacterized protein YdeI (YjbR/CyaY-like superfamily)
LQLKKHHYFKKSSEWREWLYEYHDKFTGVFLISYKVSGETESMRWEDAIQVSLYYGWIDSTEKKLMKLQGNILLHPEKKSFWSKLNKTYIDKLLKDNLIYESLLAKN